MQDFVRVASETVKDDYEYIRLSAIVWLFKPTNVIELSSGRHIHTTREEFNLITEKLGIICDLSDTVRRLDGISDAVDTISNSYKNKGRY